MNRRLRSLYLMLRELVGRWVVYRAARGDEIRDYLLFVTAEPIGTQTSYAIPVDFEEPALRLGTGLRVTILVEELDIFPQRGDLIFEVYQKAGEPIYPITTTGVIYEVGHVRTIIVDQKAVLYVVYAERSEKSATTR